MVWRGKAASIVGWRVLGLSTNQVTGPCKMCRSDSGSCNGRAPEKRIHAAVGLPRLGSGAPRSDGFCELGKV